MVWVRWTRSKASDQEIIRASIKVSVDDGKVVLSKISEIRQPFFFKEFAHLHNRMKPSNESKLQKLREEVAAKAGGKAPIVTREFDLAIPSYQRPDQLTTKAMPFLKGQGSSPRRFSSSSPLKPRPMFTPRL